MALPATPPHYPTYGTMLAPISRDHSPSPWATYSLQRAVGVSPATGVFGAATERKLKAWQRTHGLVADGIAGPTTQKTILELAGIVADRDHGLPEGVGFGFATAEGGGVLAATNWDVADAVDCGPAQWRIKGPPFSLTKLKEAFRPYVALDHACQVLAARRADFKRRNSHFVGDEALRVAVLAHNAPYGGMADTIVETYRGGGQWWRCVTRPDERAEPGEVWPPGGMTRSEWAKEYPTRILEYVA